MNYLYIDIVSVQSWTSDVPPDHEQKEKICNADLCVFRPSEDVPGRMEELDIDCETWNEVPFQRK
jgi:hypothetical protein